MGRARAVACVGGAGSLLRRRRQSRQHLGRHARERGRAGTHSLEQWGRRATRGARRPDLGPLRAVPRPSANHRAADVGCAGAIDRDRRGARRPEVRGDPVRSQADLTGHDRAGDRQHDPRHLARHLATSGGSRHARRGRGGLGNLALVRALWQSVGGGAASGGALLLQALPASRLPRPASPALRPRRPATARALRPLPRPDAQWGATRSPLLLQALPASRLPRPARARTQTRRNQHAPAATSRRRHFQQPWGMSDVSRDVSLPASMPAKLRAADFEFRLVQPRPPATRALATSRRSSSSNSTRRAPQARIRRL
jgi:hypothetical protein